MCQIPRPVWRFFIGSIWSEATEKYYTADGSHDGATRIIERSMSHEYPKESCEANVLELDAEDGKAAFGVDRGSSRWSRSKSVFGYVPFRVAYEGRGGTLPGISISGVLAHRSLRAPGQ